MKTTVVPYDHSWKTRFEQEKQTIQQALTLPGLAIEHIGSTSIEGIWAKPIIDILVGVSEAQHLQQVAEPMMQAGYTYIKKFEAGMPYRRFFVRLVALSGMEIPLLVDMHDSIRFGIDFNTLTNIHIVEYGTEYWVRHIAFRDYIQAHDKARQEYIALKQHIATIELNDLLEYNAYKEDFIQLHQAKALEWYQRIQQQHSIR